MVDSLISDAHSITFEEVSNIVGIQYFGESWGSAWGDVNKDGLPDLWVPNHRNPDQLYVNQGDGRFIDEAANILGFEQKPIFDNHGAAWADIDNDGDQDLVVLSGGGGNGAIGISNRLFFNQKGKFQEVAKDYNVQYKNASARVPLWFDYDRDGSLDLLVGSRFRPNDETSLSPTVFRQRAGFFRNTGKSTGFDQIINGTFGVLSDLSGDGVPELILKSSPRAIFDTTQLPFINVANKLLAPGSKLVGEDYAAADFNGDLRIDLFVKKASGEDRLLINTEEFGLVDVTIESGITQHPGSNVAFGDVDNDKDVDLYLVTSPETLDSDEILEPAETNTPLAANSPNILYLNNGDGTFVEADQAFGAVGSAIGSGETVSVVDYDQNGFLDLFITNGRSPQNPGPNELYQNQGNENHWFKIKFQGFESNYDGVGNTVLLTSGGSTQIREQSNGMHNRVQNEQTIHFGLGRDTSVDEITVEWSLGTIQTSRDFEVDQTLLIKEGIGSNNEDTITGTRSRNTIKGLNGNDILNGNAGRDFVSGGAGDDTITGGADNDVLVGGRGSDEFRFSLQDRGVDKIRDFRKNETESDSIIDSSWRQCSTSIRSIGR